MLRKGISPVIAIVLILMMTVSLAGLAYVWINRMMKNNMKNTDSTLETKLEILGLDCTVNNIINLTVQNIGKRKINAGTTYIYFRDVSKDRVMGRLEVDWSAQDFVNPDGFSIIPNLDISSVVNWTKGDYYELRFEFPTTNYKIEKTCTVQ